MFIDWKKNPPPIPDQLSNVLPPSIEKLHALGKESSQLNLKKGGNLMQRCKSPPTFLLVLVIVRVVSDGGVVLLDPRVNVWDVPEILAR